MEKKITKKEMFKKIMSRVADDAEMVAFLEHEVELVERKNSAPKKPTKNQIENEKFSETILNLLTDEPMTIADIQAKDETLANLSNQRISAILSKLVEDNKVVRTIKSRKSYFSKA